MLSLSNVLCEVRAAHLAEDHSKVTELIASHIGASTDFTPKFFDYTEIVIDFLCAGMGDMMASLELRYDLTRQHARIVMHLLREFKSFVN